MSALLKVIWNAPCPTCRVWGPNARLGGKQEAPLVATVCSSQPEPRVRRTMQPLANTLVEFTVVDPISDETMRRTLKRGI
jgi:hypothetical protein